MKIYIQYFCIFKQNVPYEFGNMLESFFYPHMCFQFMFRINGALQNLSILRSFSFANDSIKLNVFNPGNRTNTDGVQVIIMAFQYKSGKHE
jgi:hypothetical protein